MNRRTTTMLVLLTVATVWPLGPAFAQDVTHERGNILAIDLAGRTIEVRDPENRVATRRFRGDATVKFSDGAAFFPRPSVNDLRPPMYVHYVLNSSLVIESFDVRELGYNPSAPGGDSNFGAPKQPGVPRTIAGRVAAYDPSVRQVAVEYAGTLEAFQLTPRSNTPLRAGQRVQLRTEWSGQQEIVSELRILDQGDATETADTDDDSTVTARGGSRVQGEVLRITAQGVLMAVAGTEQLYRLANPRLLERLQVGKTVRFDWERRQGRLYITDVR